MTRTLDARRRSLRGLLCALAPEDWGLPSIVEN